MTDETSQADELRFRARFYRVGCIANLVLCGVLVAALAVLLPFAGRALGLSQSSADAAAVRAVLEAQAAAWNRGDLDGFMAGYWRDDKLTFISGGNVRRGWDETRTRYLERYFTPGPDGKLTERGELTFDELEIENLSPNTVLVRGRYQLVLADRTDWGRFTLIVRKVPDGWRIVHDHTSVPPKPEKK